MYGPAARRKSDLGRTWCAASMYQTTSVERLAPRHDGIRAHPGLISGQTSESQIPAKREECDGQIVRPS